MRILFAFLLVIFSTTLIAQQGIEYYIPEAKTFNENIPTPEEVLGFDIGEFHISPDQLHRYIDVLAKASDRVSYEITGYSHENRPLLLVAFTSAANQEKLDKIREDHIQGIDPSSNPQVSREENLIVQLGYSVHGNEASGVNAAPIMAYYLAACEDENLIKMLEKTIVLIDPFQNPDGVNRFASWVNSHKSLNNNPDPNSIEFREAWPGSRTNHYWYDLNRDWLLLQHPESQARIQAFHSWRPHVVTDHHEMGGSSTFFFQPGVKTRANPIIPEINYILTQKIGVYHAKALDNIGSLYWTEETFDDYYFGKGAAYPDLNGAIGILFEQASSRGHAQKTPYGVMTFPFTIRNQVAVSLSTLEGAWNNRKELLFHLKEYQKSALVEARDAAVKGYVFGASNDPKRTSMMIDILLQHQVEVRPLKKDFTGNLVEFPGKSSFLIPCEQAHYRTVRALMEKVTSFADSTFYDISGWTLPLAFGIPYQELNVKELDQIQTGKPLESAPAIEGKMDRGTAQIAYLFEWDPYLAPRALYSLMDQGILTKVATNPFEVIKEDGKRESFDYGTIMIPVQPQQISSAKLHAILYELAMENGLSVHSLNSGYTIDGPDFGARGFSFVNQPKTAILTGGRASSREIGQVWHLFDTRFGIPLTLLDGNRFSSIDLSAYNTLILAGGSYSELGERGTKKLKDWISQGGKVIALKSANNFLKQAEIISYQSKPIGKYPKQESKFLPRKLSRQGYIGRSIPGTIFEAKLDLTHPLSYGYENDKISIFKNSTGFVAPSSNPYNNPLYFTSDPLQSGFINDQNLEGLKESVSVQAYSFGSGKVISFFDDPFFRAYFAGEHKLFMNALFFGNMF